MMLPAIGTIATRVLVTGMNLLVIMVAGHQLGTEGLGTISLIVLGVAFILLLNNVVGGGALTYLVPRFALRQLLPPAYGWALLTTLVAWAVLRTIPLVPEAYVGPVLWIAVLQSISTIHLGILLGLQRLRSYNTISGVQALTLLIVLLVLLDRSDRPTVLDYVNAQYASCLVTVIWSTIALVRARTAAATTRRNDPVLRALFAQGGLIQSANLLQLLNYRLAYYLIEAFRGTAALGLYSVATQVAESAWLAPRSLGTVLYSRISNTHDADQQRDLTLTVAKAAVASALAVLAVLLLLPEPLFQLLFGETVIGVPVLVLLLSPGILAMAASQAFSHHFSGTGRNVQNAIGSGIGLVVTLAAGSWLIPRQGLEGAALTASLAYGANALYQLIAFLRTTDSHLRHFLFTSDDAERLRRIWRSIKP